MFSFFKKTPITPNPREDYFTVVRFNEEALNRYHRMTLLVELAKGEHPITQNEIESLLDYVSIYTNWVPSDLVELMEVGRKKYLHKFLHQLVHLFGSLPAEKISVSDALMVLEIVTIKRGSKSAIHAIADALARKLSNPAVVDRRVGTLQNDFRFVNKEVASQLLTCALVENGSREDILLEAFFDFEDVSRFIVEWNLNVSQLTDVEVDRIIQRNAFNRPLAPGKDLLERAKGECQLRIREGRWFAHGVPFGAYNPSPSDPRWELSRAAKSLSHQERVRLLEDFEEMSPDTLSGCLDKFSPQKLILRLISEERREIAEILWEYCYPCFGVEEVLRIAVRGKCPEISERAWKVLSETPLEELFPWKTLADWGTLLQEDSLWSESEKGIALVKEAEAALIGQEGDESSLAFAEIAKVFPWLDLMSKKYPPGYSLKQD